MTRVPSVLDTVYGNHDLSAKGKVDLPPNLLRGDMDTGEEDIVSLELGSGMIEVAWQSRMHRGGDRCGNQAALARDSSCSSVSVLLLGIPCAGAKTRSSHSNRSSATRVAFPSFRPRGPGAK